jgi:hypothetical protein
MTDTIYISGGIKDVPDFVEKFAAAAAEVALWGAHPVNPVDIGACAGNPCLYPGELLDSGHTWQCYMRHDIELLVHCQGIYMMRGWEKSKGASEELRIAQGLGITVYFQADDLAAMLRAQREWSRETFGPSSRLHGILAHIRKELVEVEEDPTDVTEWVDVVILALDGAWRAGHEPEDIVAALTAKYAKNRARVWPDWRDSSPDQAIEHLRTQLTGPTS